MTQYFGVVGNRDHIKIQGQKSPYWHFLDSQPDGWLSSLVYKRGDVPTDIPNIWDCGAWSYKDSEPKWGPAEASVEYDNIAADGSMVIAPDHMLIPGVDMDARRRFNAESAAQFIDICPHRLTPMATIHGDTLDERLEHAQQLMRLGYRHLAIGGIAARASQKKLVLAMVAAIREVTRGAWLHVLGLSSPDYMRNWRRMGVDSCDGSSHFKQAFAGGAFFTQEGDKLSKHQAARPGNPDCDGIVAPACECKACSTLRAEGIDTRTFGSNEHNMGRACHNQNMLMRAQKEAMRQRIVLVACCGPKLSVAAPAADLYQSALFKKSRAYAEAHGDRWFILSAYHGLLDPNKVIEPYNLTLGNYDKADRMRWAYGVEEQIMHADIWPDDTITVLAGNDYCDWIGLVPYKCDRPMQGLGIGQQLAWLDQNTKTDTQGSLL